MIFAGRTAAVDVGVALPESGAAATEPALTRTDKANAADASRQVYLEIPLLACYGEGMRSRGSVVTVGLVLLVWTSARGQGAEAALPESGAVPTPALLAELTALEPLHAESLAEKRRLMYAVLGAGVVSMVGGGALMIPDADDQAYRVAGGCAVVFGAIDAVIALTSLRGIRREATAWDRERPGRNNAAGLQKARGRWLAAERGEGVAYALNLGLDVAYLSSGLTAVVASQLGAEHPTRWLAGGLSVSVQALFLLGIDLAGLRQASRLQTRLLHDLVPGVSLAGAFAEPAVQLTWMGKM